MEASKPVEVSKKVFETWILFTDGACESQSSVGGVLISPRGQPVAMFGDTLPSELEEAFYQNFCTSHLRSRIAAFVHFKYFCGAPG